MKPNCVRTRLTGVVKLAAVVGRREERHELPLREELVAVLDDLNWTEISKLQERKDLMKLDM